MGTLGDGRGALGGERRNRAERPLPLPVTRPTVSPCRHHRQVSLVSELSTDACRVLGALLEKEVTVPATYPLTMNALLSACNQSSGRDPVMDLDEARATAAIDELREAGLTRLVHA